MKWKGSSSDGMILIHLIILFYFTSYAKNLNFGNCETSVVIVSPNYCSDADFMNYRLQF